MHPVAVIALAAALQQPASSQEQPATVIRATPEGMLPVDGVITVVFDRPVLESLDAGGGDAARYLVIEPSVKGVAEWRDPISIRFRPAEPFVPGRRYTVRVPDGIRASDGRLLVRPYSTVLTAQPSRLMAVVPDNVERMAPTGRISLIYSAPPDEAALEGVARIEFDERCAGVRHHPLRVIGVREIRDDDPWSIRSAAFRDGSWAAAFRRVVELTPVDSLPRPCAGVVVTRRIAGDPRDSVVVRIATRDSLRLTSVECAHGRGPCPAGGLLLRFSTPVGREDVLRHVRLRPEVPITISYSGAASESWGLDVRLRPSTTYTLEIAPDLRDVFGQPMTGSRVREVRTDPMPDTVVTPRSDIYVPLGVEPIVRVRSGSAPSLRVGVAHAPGDWPLEWRTSLSRIPQRIGPMQSERLVAVDVRPDAAATTDIRIPLVDTLPGLTLVRVGNRYLRIQRSNLAVHARIATRGGAVLVTGLTDARPRGDARVTVMDSAGTTLATVRTDGSGVARFALDPAMITRDPRRWWQAGFDARVLVEHGDDRVALVLTDSMPSAGAFAASVNLPSLLTATVHAERDLYRPGETLYVQAIVRDGILGSLERPAVAPDSLRFVLRRRWHADERAAREVTLSAFGTAADSIPLDPSLPLDDYEVGLERWQSARWESLASAHLRIAEYRVPAFLVALDAPARIAPGADSVVSVVRGTYVFGAPMVDARVEWTAHIMPLHGAALRIPGHDRFRFGDWARGDERESVVLSDSGTLDAQGRMPLRVRLDSLRLTTGSRVWTTVGVTDHDRQEVTAQSVIMAHPAAHYVGARTGLWTVGKPARIEAVAATPGGERVEGAPISVVLLRLRTQPREWSWIVALEDTTAVDTVGRCSMRSGRAPVHCAITPSEPGVHVLVLESADARGRRSRTLLPLWVIGGPAWWMRDHPNALRVTAARDEYVPGDTIEIAFDSPFPRSTAWISVERETVLATEVRDVRAGTVTHRMIVPDHWAPNAFISVMLVAPVPAVSVPSHPSPLVLGGTVEVKVAPRGQRLTVAVAPRTRRADAGDSVYMDVRVTDVRGRGTESEVALWAVDEGLLSLTGFRTPDPLGTLYEPRRRSVRDASTVALIAREPDSLDFFRMPLWLGRFANSLALSEIVATGAETLEQQGEQRPRSDFRSTAFFIAGVRTDAAGRASVRAKVPDDLTTFRVMAVAVSRGDAYGSGESSLIVTRPLIARPALPRFVRPGDAFLAGAVVHRENPARATVRLSAEATGIGIAGSARRELEVSGGRAVEGRLDFRATDGDTALIRLRVEDRAARDVVDSRLPIRPDHHPRWHTRTGVVRDTSTIELLLPPETDPARSRIVIAASSSPAAVIRRANAWFATYPWACTEQLVSSGLAMVALARVEREMEMPLQHDPARLQALVAQVLARQNDDGSFGYWRRGGWTTQWLTAYAGLFLLDARVEGADVPDEATEAVEHFLMQSVARPVDEAPNGAWWMVDPRARLSDRVAALEYLQRSGRLPGGLVPVTVWATSRMAWEDRLRLAEIVWREAGSRVARPAKDPTPAQDSAQALAMLREAWKIASVAGNRLELPDTLSRGTMFGSRIRPAARLLTATMLMQPEHPQLGALAELLITQGRADDRFVWSTQDWGAAVVALARLHRGHRSARASSIAVMAGERTLTTLQSESDTATAAVASFVVADSGTDSVRVRLRLRSASGAPVYFSASVEEIPRSRPLEPDHSGIIVQRWYERLSDGAPVTAIAAGEMVRVRLRVTVPNDRFFVVVDDPLPAGLEVVDPRMQTARGASVLAAARVAGARDGARADDDPSSPWGQSAMYGSWWSPWDHTEYRDDRVIFSSPMLWRGTYSASYLARATTEGTFVRPPAHAEEMYNRGVHGRSDGGTFTVAPAGR